MTLITVTFTPSNTPSVEGRKEMFYLTTHSAHFIYGYIVLTENSDSMNLQQKYKCPLKKLLLSDKTTSKNDYRILKFSLITLNDPNLPGIDTQLIPLISYEIDGVSCDFESLV